MLEFLAQVLGEIPGNPDVSALCDEFWFYQDHYGLCNQQ